MRRRKTRLISNRIVLLTAVMIWLFPFPATTQLEFQYRQHLTRANGLPDNSVEDIVQDSEGFIWLGTRSGLARYDGSQFEVFRSDNEDSTTIADSYIRDLHAVGDKLWIGTPVGLSILDLNTDKVKNIYLDKSGRRVPSGSRFSTGAGHIFNTQDGTVWIAGREGITYGWCRYVSEADTFKCYSVDPSTLSSEVLSPSRVNNVFAFVQDNKDANTLWVGTQSGLIKFNIETEEYQHFYFPYQSSAFQLSANVFRRMWQAPDGRIFCGSWSGGLNIFDPSNNTYYPAPYSKAKYDGPFFQSIRRILPKSDTEIWVTLFKSLIAYDFVEEKITARIESDFASAQIYGADFIDRDQRIWSRLNGVHIFDPALQQFEYSSFAELNDIGEGFTFDIVEDPTRDRWTVLSRDCDGLYHYYPNTGEWAKTPLDPKVNITPRFEATNAVFLNDKELLVSEYNMIFKYFPETGKMSPLDVELPIKLQSQYGRVHLDKQARVWFGTADDGLIRWDTKTDEVTQYIEEFDSDMVRRGVRFKCLDSRGNVWVSQQPDTYLYNNEVDSFLNISELNPDLKYVTEVDEGKHGRMWVTVDKSTVVLIDPSHPEFATDTIIQLGEQRSIIFDLHIDDDGNVWGFFEDKIISIDPNTLEQTLYSTEYLRDYNEIVMTKLIEGDKLVVGLANAMLIIDLNKLRKNKNNPRPYISSIEVRDEPLARDTVARRLTALELAPAENFFSISFSALGFTLGSENTFRYRLLGFQDDWTDARGRRFANYTNVTPGQHTFELEVFNSEGVRSSEVVSLPITVRKHWYEMIGVQIFGGLAVVAIVFALYRMRISQIESRERMNTEFQKQLAEVEMTALRAQMNPHFIFNCLNSIESFIIKNDTLKASTYLNDFARLIRLILQNSRSKYVPLQDELEALELYLEMESLRFVNRFVYEVNIDPDINISSIEVPPMIIQPYVENAIWHGLMHKDEKGKISIDLTLANGMLHCAIEDDGIGRERSAEINASKAKRHKSSVGMKITQDRIEMLNELYQTNTSVNIIDLYSPDGTPRGTRVELDIPV